MTCRFQKLPVVFNKSLVDLENCTSFLKTTCDLLNSTCEIDLLKLLARHTDKDANNKAKNKFSALIFHIFVCRCLSALVPWWSPYSKAGFISQSGSH